MSGARIALGFPIAAHRPKRRCRLRVTAGKAHGEQMLSAVARQADSLDDDRVFREVPEADIAYSSAKASDELPNRCADLVWRILLDKVDAWNRDFPLVRPTPAEVANTPDDLGTRIGIDEELWKIAPGEPMAIAFDDLDYVGRGAPYRQLARPYKCWEAGFPILKRRPVSRHFLIAQLPDDAL